MNYFLAFLMKVLPQILDATTAIGLKRMGEVSQKPFQDICMQKFSVQDWELRSVELSSLWQDKVNNPNWHPFKQAIKDGKLQVSFFLPLFMKIIAYPFLGCRVKIATFCFSLVIGR